MENKLDSIPNDENMVYMRPIFLRDLPQEVQEQVEGVEELFSLHNADGKQLALVLKRSDAVHLAQENDLSLQTLH